MHTSYAGGAGADAAGIWTRWSDSRVGLTWTSGVGLRRTSCDSNLSLRQHGPVSPAEVQAVCSRLNLPVLRVLQALVKGFHPNTAADSSRQVFKKPPRSKSGTDQLQKTLRYLAFPTLSVGLEVQPASYHSYRISSGLTLRIS